MSDQHKDNNRKEQAPGHFAPQKKAYSRPYTNDKTRAKGTPPQRRGLYGRPAPEATATGKPPERRYGRPAPEATATGKPPERRYGRPAPEAPSTGKPPMRRYGSPSPAPRGPQPPTRRFLRPAPNQNKPRVQERVQPILSKDARVAALLVLNRVLDGGAYASLSLDEVFQNMRLSPQDKRLAAVIVYKTVEDLIKIDFALSQFLKDAEALTAKVRNILRLSACQILLMDKIPDFAATNEAVELTRASGMEEMTGLVNGVLRSLIRGKDDLAWPKEGDANYLSVTYSIPQWLVDDLFASYPEEIALKIIAYRNKNHAVTMRRNRVLVSQEEFDSLLTKKSWEIQPGKLPGTVRAKGVTNLSQDLDFAGGRLSVQGEGSMMAVLALEPKVGMTVLDVCAAPGGKTALIAELMQNTGRVHAWDVHAHRVELIYAQAERLRLYNIRPAVRDATVYVERFDQMMDAVLLDAPCSGTGVMDNKPDIKYRLTPQGLEDLIDLQAKLLQVNAQYVKPGGTLVYATCSLLPQENAQQVKSFLQAHPEFDLLPLPDSIPAEIAEMQGEYGLQTLPHRDDIDGFFIARMRRRTS